MKKRSREKACCGTDQGGGGLCVVLKMVMVVVGV